MQLEHPRLREWQHRLLWCVGGLLLFETLSGLAIYLLPFSVPSQFIVLLHTVGGLVFTLPYLWYQARHWWIYRRIPWNHLVVLGYAGMVAVVVAIVSGLVLTVQALWGTRIHYGWSRVHLWSTFALIATVVPHVVWIMVRDHRARKREVLQPVLVAQHRFSVVITLLTAVLFGMVVAAAYVYRAPARYVELPEDYSYLYGPDRPFAPSLARTVNNKAIPAHVLGGSASCGRSGCHEQIYEEWEPSAHRYAAMDPLFRRIQHVMGTQNGAESTRYCGGCHDPISLFSGTKNLFQDDLTNPVGFREGVSCVVCHAIQEVDVRGNADYVIHAPQPYLFERDTSGIGVLISNFLIRSYPKHHVTSLSRRMFKSPEFCGACHKQFVDEEINNVGWVQLQNQYDNWRQSRWNHPGDPTKTIECRECHMPLMDSFDPARGDALDYNRAANDGKHRSHRFLGANQFIPSHLELPGGKKHVQLIEKWLRGEIEIPEIADKWRSGPVIPVQILAPKQVRPGQQLTLEVALLNNKAGHDFPTGPLDIIQSWIELRVTDDRGQEVFASGRLDDRNFIEPGSFAFKAEPVDRYGNLIDRHNLWEMVGVRYKRALFPGYADRARYTFTVPHEARQLHVKARLCYRKVNQFLLNFLFPETTLTAPITELSVDSMLIVVAP